MAIAGYINVACWLAWILYWVVTARSVKRDQEVRQGVGYLRWIVVQIAFLLRRNGLFGHSGDIRLLPRSDILTAASVALTITGLAVAIAARRKLAGNWSSGVVFKEDHELITAGLYRYVRHPIYSAVILMALGTVVASGTLSAVLFFAVVVVFLLFKASKEEELMTEHFPNEYPGYKARVKRVIPFVL